MFFYILSSLATAAVAIVIRMRISALVVPYLNRVASIYLKLDTSYSGSPSMVSLALVLILLFPITLDFSVLSSIPYAPAFSTNLLDRSYSFTITARHKVNIVREQQVADRQVYHQ